MAGLVPAIHAPQPRSALVDARNKSGHDGGGWAGDSERSRRDRGNFRSTSLVAVDQFDIRDVTALNGPHHGAVQGAGRVGHHCAVTCRNGRAATGPGRCNGRPLPGRLPAALRVVTIANCRAADRGRPPWTNLSHFVPLCATLGRSGRGRLGPLCATLGHLVPE